MNNQSSLPNHPISLSCAVYRRLLRLYPADHRREFGPALAQLFQDQCRDAWDASRTGGLLVLWFRVLLDLAKTSTLEHFRNFMNGTGGLNQKLHLFLLSRPLKSTFLAPFKWVVLGALASSLLLAWTKPSEYLAMARIALSPPGDVRDVVQRLEATRAWTAVWRQAQIQSIVSDQALARMIHDFKLHESLPHLRGRISVTPGPSPTVIEIAIYDRSEDRAAALANALAYAFLNDDANQRLIAQQFQATVARGGIVDFAQPVPIVARPNRPLIIFTGVFGGALLATLLGGLGVLLALRFRQSKA